MAGDVTTHTYSAVILGSPNIDLDVRGGRISLSSRRAPHVQGSLEIAIPSMSVLSALSPTVKKWVRVTATGGGTTRTFTLGLRSREVMHANGVVRLGLASDEDLLDDYAPSADDLTPLSYQSSLRNIINYVLGKAISGAALAASPANNADARVYSNATNVLTNPRARGNVDGWGVSGGTVSRNDADPVFGTGFQIAFSAGDNRYFETIDSPLTPGRRYLAEVSARSSATHASSYFGVAIYNRAGALVGGSSPVPMPIAPTVSRKWVIFDTPPDAAFGRVRLTIGDISGSQTVVVSGAVLREAPIDPADRGYFDGDTTDTAMYQYTYGQDADPNKASTSRIALVDRTPQSLVWKAGQSGLDFIRPLVQAAGYRLVCDEARVWTLRSETYAPTGTLSLAYGDNVVDSTDISTRDADGWFDACLVTYTWTDLNGEEQTMTDAYAATSSYTKLAKAERRTPYPGPGLAQHLVKQAAKRSREASVTAVAKWSTKAEQAVTVTLDRAPVLTGTVASVDFNIDRDEMTIRAQSD